MSQLNREQFLEQLLERVRTKFPLVKITEGGEPFTLKLNGQQFSLENIFRLVSLRPDDKLHHIDRWMVELLRVGEGTPDQFGTYDEVQERVLPMVLPAEAANAFRGMVTTPLVDGLIVAYALDQDRTISYIPAERFKQWNISVDDLHGKAIENLIGRSQSLGAHAAEDEHGKVNLILFQTMDGYDASRLLLPSLHDRLRSFLGSPFAAAIPNRDILLCFRNDEKTVSRLRTQVAEDYSQMPHQVTDRLMLITADGIAIRE